MQWIVRIDSFDNHLVGFLQFEEEARSEDRGEAGKLGVQVSKQSQQVAKAVVEHIRGGEGAEVLKFPRDSAGCLRVR